jgi:hypothetical protein
VRDFVARIIDVNTEIGCIDRKYSLLSNHYCVMHRFNDHFKIFVKLWKGILAEKKDLNAKIAALKKARSNTDVLRKKVYKAEEKEPRDQVSTL